MHFIITNFFCGKNGVLSFQYTDAVNDIMQHLSGRRRFIFHISQKIVKLKVRHFFPFHFYLTLRVAHRFDIYDRKHFPVLSYFMIYRRDCKQSNTTGATSELLTLPGHLSSPPGFSVVHVGRSLVFYVLFVDRCQSFCFFSLGYCVACPSSSY